MTEARVSKRTSARRAYERAALALVLALSAGCAGARATPSGGSAGRRCGGAAGPYCLTPPVCAWDSAQGCERCRCSDAPYVPAAR